MRRPMEPALALYEEAKKLARDPDPAVRAALAARADLAPELLAYLSGDPDERVRAAAAGNPASPMQTAGALARDAAQSVRLALAGRIVRLLPDLTADAQRQAYRLAAEALMTLALDEALSVRETLSSALKDMAAAPPPVVRQLAYDTSRAVAEPILRYCLLLPDEDLLTLIATRDQSWLRVAIATRATVSEGVTNALIETGDLEATGVLIGNEGATLSERILANLVEGAAAEASWQAPLAKRRNLPTTLARRLAEFVDETVFAVLAERSDYDADTLRSVVIASRRRQEYQSAQQRQPDESAEERALRHYREGELSEERFTDALGLQDFNFARAALAMLARVPADVVRRILDQQNAKTITALCHRARLSMRTALMVQQRLARVPSAKLLYPRGGTDYPLSEEEMLFQLSLYGVEA